MNNRIYDYGEGLVLPENEAYGPRGAHGLKTFRALSDWEMLIRGKTLGKRIGIGFQSGGGLGNTLAMNMFEVMNTDDYALPLTVQLSPPEFAVNQPVGPLPNLSGTQDNAQQNLNGGAVSIANPYAIIEWGVGGVSNTAEVDIHNGAKLTITASWVRIKAAVEDHPLSTLTDMAYQLSAFIGPGMDKGLGGQRTIIAPDLPAVNVETDPRSVVPRFARRVRMAGAGPAGAGFVGSLIFYRGRTTPLSVCEYLFAANTPDSFPVPNGAYYFSFVPRAADIDEMQAIFDLAI